MDDRQLGSSGIRVSRVGLGCMNMSHEPRDESASARVVSRALDLGVTFFDTANRYGDGHNEELLGRTLAGRRDDVVIATKFGFEGSPGEDGGVNGRPEHAHQACRESLRRLRIDVIDLYYLHRIDPQVPVEESVGAMAELVDEGLVRAIGLCEVAPETLRRAMSVHPVSAVQSEYSLWCRDPEGGVLDACRELGVLFVAYSPLGVGFLSGSVEAPDQAPSGSRLARDPRLAPGNLERNLSQLSRLRAEALQAGCSPVQLALAWLLTRSPDVVPIPGTRSAAHLEEDVQAVAIDLDPARLEHLDNLFSHGSVAGPRKSEAGMRLIGL